MKKIIRILFTMLLVCSLTTCSFQLPEKITVKTAAKYNFCIGNVEKDFSDMFSIQNILTGAFASSQGTKVYDYYPNKNNGKIQKYLMKMPIQDIPIDFSSYFDASSIGDSVKGVSFSNKIKIPETALSLEQDLAIDALAGTINSLLTGAVAGQNITFPAATFTSVSYDQAKMTLSSITPATSAGIVTLKYNGTTVGTGVYGLGVGEIDVSNGIIYKTGMTLEFSSSVTACTVKMDSASKVKQVVGITTPSGSAPSIPVNVTIPNAGGANLFTECVIGDGSLDITLTKPSKWSGVDISYDLALSGALTGNLAKTDKPNSSLSLANQTVKNADTNVVANITFSMNNATIIFADKINLKMATNIKKYSKIGFEMSGITTSVNENIAISAEMKQFIQSLELGQSGLRGTYKNTLPEGNDIKISANSTFIGLSESTNIQTVKSNTPNGTIDKLTSSAASRVVKFKDTPSAADEFDKIDLKVNIDLPGKTAAKPNQIMIQNVEPGKEYEIAINLEPDLNWKNITIKTDGLPISGKIPTGLNLSQIFNSFTSTIGGDFASKLSIPSMKVHLFAIKPDNMAEFKDAKFTGDLKIFFSADGTTDLHPAESIVFMSAGSSGLSFVDNPELAFDKDNPDTIVSDFDKLTTSSTADLAPLIEASKNDTTGCLYVDYDIKLDNGSNTNAFTISKESFTNSGSKNPSIAIYAYIEIPLAFTATDDIKIDLLAIAGMNTGADLLGRTEPPSGDLLGPYGDVVRSVCLNYNSSVLPFWGKNGESIQINLDWDGPSKDDITPVQLTLDKGKLELSDFNQILNLYPLTPDVNVKIPKGSFSIGRDVGFSMNINLSLETDPTYPLTFELGGN